MGLARGGGCADSRGMKVFLDGEELAIEQLTLKGALSAGLCVCEERGRIIVEVWADDALAPEADLAEPPETSPYAEEIRLISAEPRSLVRTVLLDVSEALSFTRQTQRQAADHLQVGENVAALNEIGDALRTWETVRRAVEEGCALLKAPGDLSQESLLNAALICDLVEKLTALKEALTNEDWPLLADLLAYDLDEHIERWQDELRRMSDVIAAS